ncbi:unnamed protein product [Dibothriocephalus latus]|uniref:Uncharacterized protein n=1 Tax=Dibothriocephalus latus TaxID=60516 RepID=A0A3P6Q7N3_DIBLA|nr:unnamed protein product [Dibothriocephalus latus]
MLGKTFYLLSVFSCYSFLDVIKAVLFLLANPNFDSANNSFGYLSAEYRDSFEEVCRQFLAGFPIKGEVYPANEKWCEWARANNCFPVPKRNQSGEESQPPSQSTPDITPSDGPATPLAEQLKAKVGAKLSDPDVPSDRTSFSTPSTYVPSVANVRYSLGTYSDQFGSIYTLGRNNYLQTVRILLHQQGNRGPRIFYFSDFLGCSSCQKSSEPVYFCNQSDLETHAKASSFIPWASGYRNFCGGERSSSYSRSPSVSCISALFRINDVAPNPPELFPDCGDYVLCALFAEPRSKAKQMEDDPLDGSLTLEDFFNLKCEIDCACPIDGHQLVVEEGESGEEEMEEDESISDGSLSSCSSGQNNDGFGEPREEKEDKNDDEEENNYTERADASEGRRASEDSLNSLYARPEDVNNALIRHCSECPWSYIEAAETMQELTPSEWIFFQTRWPPVLAPQEVIDLEKNYPARIPSWRGSTPRLVKDVIIFCRQHPKSDCLLLLDPLVSKYFANNLPFFRCIF